MTSDEGLDDPLEILLVLALLVDIFSHSLLAAMVLPHNFAKLICKKYQITNLIYFLTWSL